MKTLLKNFETFAGSYPINIEPVTIGVWSNSYNLCFGVLCQDCPVGINCRLSRISQSELITIQEKYPEQFI